MRKGKSEERKGKSEGRKGKNEGRNDIGVIGIW